MNAMWKNETANAHPRDHVKFSKQLACENSLAALHGLLFPLSFLFPFHKLHFLLSTSTFFVVTLVWQHFFIEMKLFTSESFSALSWALFSIAFLLIAAITLFALLYLIQHTEKKVEDKKLASTKRKLQNDCKPLEEVKEIEEEEEEEEDDDEEVLEENKPSFLRKRKFQIVQSISGPITNQPTILTSSNDSAKEKAREVIKNALQTVV
ncbi:hypothetical protein T06_14610 [Trichinella sp. T6]|nr:hypothetical protein T06_14610 [Trichinella sp. T6]